MQNQEDFNSLLSSTYQPVSLKERNYMSHERRLYDFTQELAHRYGNYDTCDDVQILALEDLPAHEQSKLLQLFIESIDREIETEAILGHDYSINSDYNCSLLFFLDRDSPENSANLAEVIKKNLITYYRDLLQKELDQACEDYTRALQEANEPHNLGDYYYDLDRDCG